MKFNLPHSRWPIRKTVRLRAITVFSVQRERRRRRRRQCKIYPVNVHNLQIICNARRSSSDIVCDQVIDPCLNGFEIDGWMRCGIDTMHTPNRHVSVNEPDLPFVIQTTQKATRTHLTPFPTACARRKNFRQFHASATDVITHRIKWYTRNWTKFEKIQMTHRVSIHIHFSLTSSISLSRKITFTFFALSSVD